MGLLKTYLNCMKVNTNDFEGMCKNAFESFDTCEVDYELKNPGHID